MIKASNLTHIYGKDTALKDISIHIKEGDFISLIGESGSGKSTLLSILSTLLTPTNGKLSLLGTDIKNIKDIDTFRKENIGFVFQFHYLINYLTVKENITLALENKNDTYINELLEYLKIDDIKNKYPNEISGGQRQRAAIARALANKPKIVFADEPTGNLDSKNSKKVFELLKHFNAKGTTIVVATHDKKLAKSANTIYKVKDGTVSKHS